MKKYLQNSENMDKCMIGAYKHLRKECVRFNAHEFANDAVRKEYMENYKCMNTCIDYLELRGYNTK